MKKYMKSITAFLLVLVGLVVMSSAALAVDPTFFKVEIDNVEYEVGDTIYLERGSTVDVEVEMVFEGDIDDVKVEAWLGGYEYDDIEDKTSQFDIHGGTKHKKVLTLELPVDMDAEDYSLHVEVANHDDIFQADFGVEVNKLRHGIAIDDVILRPGTTVQAGNALYATVWLENMGERKEKLIDVTVSIPELGVSDKEKMEELVACEDEDADDCDVDEYDEIADSVELRLPIPEDAVSGDYEVLVKVEYRRGNEVLETTESIYVEGASSKDVSDSAVLVNYDVSSQDGEAGDELVYKVMLANLGDEDAVYSVEVSGEKLWAESEIEPVFLKLGPDSTGEIDVSLVLANDAEAGKHTFTVKVKEGNSIVDEKTLVAEVKEDGSAITGATTTTFGGVKNALVIGFGVLVVLLVILGLIVAFNKMNKDDDEELPSEGQAYY